MHLVLVERGLMNGLEDVAYATVYIQARNLFVLQEVLLRKHLSPFVIYRFFPLLFPWLQTYLLNLVKTLYILHS